MFDFIAKKRERERERGRGGGGGWGQGGSSRTKCKSARRIASGLSTIVYASIGITDKVCHPVIALLLSVLMGSERTLIVSAFSVYWPSLFMLSMIYLLIKLSDAWHACRFKYHC